MRLRTLVFVLVPITIGVLASATGFSLLWRLFILSLLVITAGYGWTCYNIRNLRAEIGDLPSRNYSGDIISTSLRLTNIAKIPKLFLKVQTISDSPDFSKAALVNINPGATFNFQSNISCSQRGRYSLGEYIISAGDPLGLFERSRRFGQAQSILIYPKTYDLPFFDPLTYLSNGYGTGKWISPQTSPNVAGVREYIDGESLRHIHWQSTAHSSNLMVKVFDPDRSRSLAKAIWIVLDMQAAVQSGSGSNSTEEYSITCAASIGKKYIAMGWPVGLLAAGDQRIFLPPASGSEHFEKINTVLAILKARGQIPVDQLLGEVSGRLGLDSLTLVITPSLNNKLVISLIQVRRQMGAVVTILLDANSFGGNNPTPGVPGPLLQNGVQVYTLRSGNDLSVSLDSRKI